MTNEYSVCSLRDSSLHLNEKNKPVKETIHSCTTLAPPAHANYVFNNFDSIIWYMYS